MSAKPANRLLVVSNRLPIVLKKADGKWSASAGAGGLVTALAPILQARGGVWIGWPATYDSDGIDQAMREYSLRMGYDLAPVQLSESEVQGYYYGFANEILWPLFHGLETRCNFAPQYWRDYVQANHKFADVVRTHAKSSDFVWIHDYQLMLVADLLRQMGIQQQIGFFLHIPFPAPDIFFKLPWRAQLLRGMLAFDLIGFQTVRHRRNFTHCLQQLGLPDLQISGRGDVVRIRFEGRDIRAGAFPISIDAREISREATTPEISGKAQLFREKFPNQKLVIGIDRLDYTKGIPDRLEAFRLMLVEHPEWRNKVSLIQITVPSRESVPEYERLRRQIQQLVGEINGEFTSPGERVPIHYLHRALKREDVFTILRAADVGLVTPLRDGMNLVAKEYCACNVDETGVLVLSEFAGAAAELKHGALLINPYDVEGTATAIHQALVLPEPERKIRMRKLRNQIVRHDIFRWLDMVLEAAFAKRLSDFPRLEDHLPSVDLSLLRTSGNPLADALPFLGVPIHNERAGLI
jgi:alpha,alpha-trehalose-phosphate synthase [UDP-forming]